MLVCKTYFRIMKRLKGTIIMYVAIFIGLAALIVTISGKNTATETYETKSINVAVIDQDHSELSKGIYDYIAANNKIVKVKNTENEIKDALYWHRVSYIITIPKGLEESVKNHNAKEIITQKIDGTSNTAYIDEALKQYLSIFDEYQACGYNVSDALTKTKNSVNNTTKVEIVKEKENDKSENMSNCGYYFQYVPFALLSICITVISMMMLFFNEENIKKRCICSSMKLKDQNMQMMLANALFVLGVMVVIMIAGIFVTKGDLLRECNTWFYMGNMIVFALISVAISFFLGTLLKSVNAINGATNVVALGCCFLGGVYVPLEVLPKGVLKLAHFIPTYWYIKANEGIAYMTQVNDRFVKQYLIYIGVELVFAITFLCLGLVCSKRNVAAQ